MAERYTKTENGRAEIRERALALPRTSRNLLLIIDSSKDGDQWVSLVQGATDDDLQLLIEAGLVAPAVGAASSFPAAAAPGRAVASAAGATEAPLESQAALSYAELYKLLSSLGKEHLGLMKGYKFVLSIEKADGLGGLQDLARDLVSEVERTKGASVARTVKRALRLN